MVSDDHHFITGHNSVGELLQLSGYSAPCEVSWGCGHLEYLKWLPPRGWQLVLAIVWELSLFSCPSCALLFSQHGGWIQRGNYKSEVSEWKEENFQLLQWRGWVWQSQPVGKRAIAPA